MSIGIVIMLGVAVLGSAFFVNRFVQNWFAERLKEVLAREATLDRMVLSKKRLIKRLDNQLGEDRKKLDMYERLKLGQQGMKGVSPEDWLLDNKHISLSQFIKARKYADQFRKSFVEACLALHMIDRKVARDALEQADMEEQGNGKSKNNFSSIQND